MKKLIASLWILQFFFIVHSYGNLINPSFEIGYDGYMPNGSSTAYAVTRTMPVGWEWRSQGAMNGYASGLYYWCTDGQWSLYLFASTAANHYEGDYLEYFQTVDLTGFSQLSLDAYLRNGGENTNSYISVNGEKLWTSNQQGEYSIILDISQFHGLCEIELGVEVFSPFDNSADGLTYFDNLQLIPEPATFALLGLGSLVLRKRR